MSCRVFAKESQRCWPAFAAAKELKLILTMPGTMSTERRKLRKIPGAKFILAVGAKGMKGAIARAEERHRQIPNSIVLQPFSNPPNPAIRGKTTAGEIGRDTDDIGSLLTGA